VRRSWMEDEFEGDARPLVELWPGNRLLSSEKTVTGEKISPEKALGMSAVFTCVNVIANSLATLPLVLYKRTGKGKGQREIADWHPVYKVLTMACNRYDVPFDFMHLAATNLCLNGNVFIEVLVNGRNDVNELFLLTAEYVKIETLRNGDRRYTYKEPGKPEELLDQDKLIHVRGLSTDGVLGKSPITQAREAIALGLTLERFQAEFMANDATPRGILKSEQPLLTMDQRDKVRHEWQKSQGGRNRNRIAVMDGNFDYQQIGMSLEDAQFIESRKFQLEEVARWYNVPPHKVGLLDRATNNNIEHQGKEFESDCLDPYLTKFEQRFSFILLSPKERNEGYFLEFDREDLDRADSDAKENRVSKRILTGQWSFNEARASRNEPPFKEGDMRIQPGSHVPVGTKPEPATDNSKAGDDTGGGEDKDLQKDETKKNAFAVVEPVVRDALQRVLKREGKALSHKLNQMGRRGSEEELLVWSKLYREGDLRKALEQALDPVAAVMTCLDVEDADKLIRELIDYSINVSEHEVKVASKLPLSEAMERAEGWHARRAEELVEVFFKE
ncbi:MAG: phage portal protein, partial [Candidatus Obscuribacterales bacterium]|nr:phage portal protein [Candidatus Obscuribacterales bacterium]